MWHRENEVEEGDNIRNSAQVLAAHLRPVHSSISCKPSKTWHLSRNVFLYQLKDVTYRAVNKQTSSIMAFPRNSSYLSQAGIDPGTSLAIIYCKNKLASLFTASQIFLAERHVHSVSGSGRLAMGYRAITVSGVLILFEVSEMNEGTVRHRNACVSSS